MSAIPEDIMAVATEIVDRIAKVHTWKGDCVADVAHAILAERNAEHERCNAIVRAAWGKNISLELFEDGISSSSIAAERDRLRDALVELERYVAMKCYDQKIAGGHEKSSDLLRLLDRVRAVAQEGGAS